MSQKSEKNHVKRIMSDCTLCPRNCHADRLGGQKGYCGQTAEIRAARAALHFWEEPCISGKEGSGTVFFSGCVLRCIFCQNHNIAQGKAGQEISLERLAEIFLELQEKKANNINLVTPTHFVPQIAAALEQAKKQGLHIPVVYNTGSYEKVETLRMMDGLVDIYLPDMKYVSAELGRKYSGAADYFEVASAAIAEMVRQVGKPVFAEPVREKVGDGIRAPKNGEDDEPTAPRQNDEDDEPEVLLKRGVIVRHLVLPGNIADSKKVIRYLYETYGNDIFISIMSQYTPLREFPEYPELNRRLRAREYEKVVDFALDIGVENGFLQEGDVAEDSFIPEFNGEGL